jgi:propanol-preferring alcohol dehydrogenase
MRAWVTHADGDLTLREVPDPEPAADELLVDVLVCGLCRTDLHVIDREIPRHRTQVVPGHQVVGRVIATGDAVEGHKVGDLVGIAWLRRTCGQCTWCRTGRENLCPSSAYTGWDADGGYAELTTVPAAFAYPLPADTDPVATAPLLCAGIIGYRALARAAVPPGGLLGLYGFGSSAHLTAQLAQAAGARIAVMSRGENDRQLARELGAVFVGGTRDQPPEPLDAAIVFAPAGIIVPAALTATAPGGTVVLAGIHMTDIPSMSYADHLFGERDLRTVTANTRADGAAFLRLAHNLGISPTTRTLPFDRVDDALADLRAGAVAGSSVIVIP